MDYLVHHLLRSNAQRRPDQEALVAGSQRLSYESVWSRVSALAGALVELGLRRYDRVGIQLPTSQTQVSGLFAAAAAGGVIVPIHASLFPRQVAHIARDCQLKFLITQSTAWQRLRREAGALPELSHVILTDVPAHADAVSQLGATQRGETELGVMERGITPELHNLDSLISLRAPAPADRSVGADLAAILYTSGSTGRAKGVMLSHANLVSGATIVSEYLSIRHHDRILSVLPFSFDAGLNQLTTAFQQGATLVLTSFVLANQIVQRLRAERITGLAGVPTMWNLLVQSDSFRLGQFPHLRYITNTGGALPQATLTQLRCVLKQTEVFLMYGLTEAFRSTYLPPDQLDRRPGSIGKAIPNTELFVVNADGQPCAAGEEGELVHHGPTVSLGYWNQPELTAHVLRPHPFPGPGQASPPLVCYSGDLVVQDNEGYLYFVSRRDNQIKTSGYRVSPSEVEEVLFEHGEVAQAAVVGVPDDMLGQAIHAFVVPRSKAVTADELLEHCAAGLPSYMIPKHVSFVKGLPTTSSGKVDYAQLRRDATERSAANDPQPG